MHEVYKSKDINNLNVVNNPLDPINNIQYLAKRFMKAHGSYNRDDLQDPRTLSGLYYLNHMIDMTRLRNLLKSL